MKHDIKEAMNQVYRRMERALLESIKWDVKTPDNHYYNRLADYLDGVTLGLVYATNIPYSDFMEIINYKQMLLDRFDKRNPNG